MKKSCFGNNQQGRCACNKCMEVRFPKLCMRCGSLTHYAEDCTRMPAGLGMSQHERDMVRQVRAERNAVLLAALAFVLALVIMGAP